MKKITALLLALLMLASAFSMIACDTTEEPTEAPTEEPTEEASKEPEVIPETPYPLDCLRINGIDISEYVIVSDTSLGGVMTTAANELQKYIELTCGTKLDIVEGTVPAGTKRILIDTENQTDNDTWGFSTDEDGLKLTGTAKRSALYAVYMFLEKHLDWRFFTSDCETVYEHSLIDIKDLDYTYTHQYKVRGLYAYDYFDPWISVKRYFNENSGRQLGEELGGTEHFTHMGIHNFGPLAETGYEVNQPCLNNQQNLDNILKNTIAYLEEHPEATSVHISQNDNERYCQCDECLADIEYYGAPSGSIIEMLNFVCEGLENYDGGKFKDILVITFAYRYSFTAPDNIICHDNIVIEYTIIDLCQQHPITYQNCTSPDDPLVRDNQDLVAQIDKWKEISKQCLIYDYGLNCRYYYCPYPDFDVLRENYAYYASLNPWGYMNLCNPHQNGCDFSELRFYLYAKLLEDPYMTEEQYQTHINEFLAAYYGPAWEVVKEYMDFTQRIADEHGQCYGGYSSPEMMWGEKVFGTNAEYLQSLFAKMFDMTEDEEQLIRIRRLWVGMEYLRIGDIHTEEWGSRDDERRASITAQIENFWNEVRDLGLEWVYESGKVPGEIRYNKNPRKLYQWIHNFRG